MMNPLAASAALVSLAILAGNGLAQGTAGSTLQAPAASAPMGKAMKAKPPKAARHSMRSASAPDADASAAAPGANK